MSESPIGGLISALFQDSLSYNEISLPGVALVGETLKHGYESWRRRRIDIAREIFLDELRAGDRSLSEAREVDEFAAIIHRYGRAAVEGAARVNLRLMARAIAGIALRQQLFADEFLRYAELIASMRPEEIILVGTFHRHATRLGVTPGAVTEADVQTRNETQKELIPAPFATEDDFEAALAAVIRTGLIVYRSGYGGSYHKPSSLLDKFVDLTNPEEALKKEAERDRASNLRP